ncbi:MAG: RNA-binding S4 domain-containing protein [Pseudomonadota bacterium]
MTDSLRIDKWLFFTRFYKTRGQASAAVTGGHVARNAERAKPAVPVKVGDQLTITRERFTWVVDVVGLPKRRGPAKEAQACYVETPESEQQRKTLAEALKSDRLGMPQTPGKPDKHTRRQLRQFKDTYHDDSSN